MTVLSFCPFGLAGAHLPCLHIICHFEHSATYFLFSLEIYNDHLLFPVGVKFTLLAFIALVFCRMAALLCVVCILLYSPREGILLKMTGVQFLSIKDPVVFLL